MLGRLRDGDRFTESVPRTDPDPKFQLVVEPLAGAEARNWCVWRLRPAPSADEQALRTGGSTTPGRDSRWARTYSSAATGYRDGTACRHWWRGECRHRSRCNRRCAPADATCKRRQRAGNGSTLPCSGHCPGASNSDSRACARPDAAWFPSARNRLSVAPEAASAALAASPVKRPAARAAGRSRIRSPMATPPLGSPPLGLKIPSGRFWIGKSG